MCLCFPCAVSSVERCVSRATLTVDSGEKNIMLIKGKNREISAVSSFYLLAVPLAGTYICYVSEIHTLLHTLNLYRKQFLLT